MRKPHRWHICVVIAGREYRCSVPLLHEDAYWHSIRLARRGFVVAWDRAA